MAQLFINLTLAMFGLFFVYTGAASFLRPATFARSLALTANGPSGEIEIRAQYGGFFFAAGLVQFLALSPALAPVAALTVSVVIFGGLCLGRYGAALFKTGDDKLAPVIRALFYIDAVGALLAVGALYAAVAGGRT